MAVLKILHFEKNNSDFPKISRPDCTTERLHDVFGYIICHCVEAYYKGVIT